MTLSRRLAALALASMTFIVASVARADPGPAPAPAQPSLNRTRPAEQPSSEAKSAPADEKRGRAQSLASPVLFEQLADKLWELESQTLASPRTAIAANLVLGLGQSSQVPHHAVFGPGLSVRFVPWGRFTRRRHDLERRFELLTRHQAARLDLLLEQEIARAHRELTSYETSLTETRAARGKAGAAALSDEVLQRRIDFLDEVIEDLEHRSASTRADLALLENTREEKRALLSNTSNIVAQATGSRWHPFVEFGAAYTFQLSQYGLGEKLGGLTAGLGLGLIPPGAWPPFALGIFLGQDRVWGAYLSTSTEIIN